MQKQNHVIILSVVFLFSIISCSRNAGRNTDNFVVKRDINYRIENNLNNYDKERCKLDLYLPENIQDFPILVWFYGGSLKRGDKKDRINVRLASYFAQSGIAVAMVNYRLSPKATYPSYIQDAASSIAWVKKNISNYGGSNKEIFIGGHSAGAYLVLMVALDSSYLGKYGLRPDDDLAGVIALSGQTMTHYTIRDEMGIENPHSTSLTDEKSPQYNAKAVTPPIFIVWGERDTRGRIDENKKLIEKLENMGNSKITYKEIPDHTHWGLVKKIPNDDDPLSKEMKAFISGI